LFHAQVASECPLVNSLWAVAYIRGLQEGDPATSDPRYVQVIATAKHFAVYSFEGFFNSEPNRMDFNALVTQQDLADTYLVPFQAAFTQGRALGAMCSYSAINGVPSCANEWLLTEVLQNSWAFDGYTTGDCGAVEGIGEGSNSSRCHKYTHSNSSTCAAALSSGISMDCGSGFTKWLPNAVNDGNVSISDLAKAASRNLSVRFRAGVFDDPSTQPMAQLGNESVCTPYAAALSLRAAEEGMVLLKNALNSTGLGLPLRSGSITRLALIGGNANDTMMQLCSYYSTPCGGFDAMISPLAALPAFVSQVDYALGCDAGCSNTSGFAQAAAVASEADATIVAVGLNCKLSGEGMDRGSFTLPGHQDDLIALSCSASAGKPCIVAIFAGAPLDISRALSNPNVTAVIFAGYGGPQGGTAFARVVFGSPGAAPPAGRLSTTWYTESYVNEVDVKDMSMRPGQSLLNPAVNVPGRTYRFYSGNSTLLPFGFGLSLTTWTYTNVSGPAMVSIESVSKFATLGRTSALRAPLDSEVVGLYSVNVTNTGSVDSDDVVLGFLKPPSAGINGVPLLKLIGFERVFVRAGETVTVWIGLRARDLTEVNVRGEIEEHPGEYTIIFGSTESNEYVRLRELSITSGGPPLSQLTKQAALKFSVGG